MKFKKEQYLNKWRSVFKILPVKTEDGFTVWMERVYEKRTDDLLNPVTYHTNPLQQLINDLDSFIDNQLADEAADITKEINELRTRIVKKSPLTEGNMRRSGSNPPPILNRKRRPPPPPPPPQPRGRKIGGSYLTTEHLMDAWDIKKQNKQRKYTTGSTGPL